ncbi:MULTISPECIES: O-antigen translocase [unclassified Pseudomonas]|uniref:O-antigen translocase n=1 Tax=unclassified Pseudomonas TaxID=196821 RepID=UPI000F56E0C4|nr:MULTISPECIES: O-antigen translocase [unclassified Pseudomonas]AZF46965.1 Lipid III flippase [Pseudomonas sp. R2-7-07]AZF57514.1 Lipid III flippase [Pseudomonas sp. R11-23-07]
MTLLRTSFLNGIAVIIKMLTLLGINKMLAIYVGPSGYAALGQFQNAVQMVTTFSTGAISNGVTKYTAEYKDDEEAQRRVWRTAGTIAFVGSVVTSVLIVCFSKPLAMWCFNDESFYSVFIWCAATVVFFSFNTLLLAILNGRKEINRYILANIGGSVLSLLVTIVMVVQYGLYGALISLVLYQSIAFFVTCLLCYRTPWFRFSNFLGRLDKQIAINLTKFTAMALTTAACVPVSHILVRNYLGSEFGWETAGYWEAMWRLSTAYLLLVTTTLGLYFLPKLSELVDPQDIRKEIVQGYKLILPVAMFCGLMIYLLRDFIIGLLFTNAFSPMRDFFAWQMLGDTLKIASWILAYLMLGKAMVKMYIVTEVVFAFSFYVLTIVLTKVGGPIGVTWAHAVNYGFYLVVMYFLIYRKLNQHNAV